MGTWKPDVGRGTTPNGHGSYGVTPPHITLPGWFVAAAWLVPLAFTIAVPFTRHTGWIGWVASSIVVVVAVGLSTVLIRGWALETIRWCRDHRTARGGNGEP
jgi:hypothetical protein